jgi:HEPN domain-containing protein
MAERDLRALSEEWFEFAERDLLSVKILYNNNGPTSVIAIELQQATEKYLKGYLIAQGWRLVKTHDLEELLTEAIKGDARFEEHLGYCRELTGVYIEEKYPGRSQRAFSRDEMREMIEMGERLIGMVKGMSNNRKEIV